MGWENIDLKNVATGREPIPAGVYHFELLSGAKYDDKGGISAMAAVNGSSEYTGRRVFLNFPDPETLSSKGKLNTWSSQALKLLSIAMGVDVEEGEDKVTYLNRAAGGRFTAQVAVTAATEKYPNPKNQVNSFSFKPSNE